MIGGIAGIFHLDKAPVKHGQIRVMIDLLGNDKASRKCYHIEPWLAMAKMTLHGTEKGVEAADLITIDSCSVISDAFIANRIKLCSELELSLEQGIHSDDVILIHAYLKWGTDCVNHIEGQFSFVIWDKRMQRFFCAVDHLARRPLYYHWTGTSFFFASELKSIRAVTEIHFSHNTSFYIDMIEGLVPDEGVTCLNEVLRLNKGNSLCIDQDGLKIRPYWSLARDEFVRYRNDREYVDETLSILEDVLREYDTNKSDANVATILSNDLCSVFSIALLKKVFPEKSLHVTSYLMPPGQDELSDEIRSDLKKIQACFPFLLDDVYTEVLPSGFDASIDYKMWVNDTPFVNPIGNDHDVIFNSLRRTGREWINPGFQFNPFDWDGREQAALKVLSGSGIGYLKFLISQDNRLKTIKSTLVQLTPFFMAKKHFKYKNNNRLCELLIRKDLMSQDDMIERMMHKFGLYNRYPRLPYYRDHSNHISSWVRTPYKPTTSIERRYDIWTADIMLDRRVLEVATRIPPEIYAGNGKGPTFFNKILDMLDVPLPLRKYKTGPWPIDTAKRIKSIQPAIFREFKDIGTNSPLWDILDAISTSAYFQKLERQSPNIRFNRAFSKMCKVLLLHRFMIREDI